MKHVRFQVITDDETGEAGIFPLIFMNKGWDSYRPTQLPGHDLIDHTSRDETGEVYQEIRAMGAYYFVEDFGYKIAQRRWNNQHRAAIMGRDFLDELDIMLQDSFNTGNDIPDLDFAPHAKLSKKEKGMFKILEHAFIMRVKEEEPENEDDFGDFPVACDFSKENLDKIFSWLKYGYALAKRRYKGEAYWASDMRERINKTLKTAWNTLEQYADTGEVFTLSIDIENGHAEINHRYGLI